MQRFLTFTITFLLLTGCANIPALLSTPEPVSSQQSESAPTGTAIPSATPTTFAPPPVTPGGPRTLRIWVPSQFDPAAESPAGALLQERLDEFVARRPGLHIEVRVKAESMIGSLGTTRAAAPSVMPDLVALSRPDLESATSKGLLHPLDGLTTLLDDPDWYPYARQMAHIQNTAFGLPFAGDALTLVGYGSPLPTNWDELPDEMLLIFPAADPWAFFSLSLYLSSGGMLQDSQGKIAIDETLMTEVLSFYRPSSENEFFPRSVLNYETNAQAWDAFREQRGNMVVSWASRFLSEQTLTLTLAPLPGLDTGQYSLAAGWSWALAGSNPENQPLAVELAEFLSDSLFLAEWSRAAGYLPTRPTALASWEDAQSKLGLAQTAETASLVPSQELLTTVGPLFAEAVLSVINEELLPAEAAQLITEKLK